MTTLYSVDHCRPFVASGAATQRQSSVDQGQWLQICFENLMRLTASHHLRCRMWWSLPVEKGDVWPGAWQRNWTHGWALLWRRGWSAMDGWRFEGVFTSCACRSSNYMVWTCMNYELVPSWFNAAIPIPHQCFSVADCLSYCVGTIRQERWPIGKRVVLTGLRLPTSTPRVERIEKLIQANLQKPLLGTF